LVNADMTAKTDRKRNDEQDEKSAKASEENKVHTRNRKGVRRKKISVQYSERPRHTRSGLEGRSCLAYGQTRALVTCVLPRLGAQSLRSLNTLDVSINRG